MRFPYECNSHVDTMNFIAPLPAAQGEQGTFGKRWRISSAK